MTTTALRDYQRQAVEAIRAKLVENRSTLAVLPTGTGKTVLFAELVSGFPGRCMVLVHRDELAQQAVRKLESATARIVEIEKAWSKASTIFRHTVVGSVQTLQRERLEKWPRDAFSLLVVDESHHATSPSWRNILDHFSSAKVVGVTATPQRADRIALGDVFESEAYTYPIETAIDDGWLVPVRAVIPHKRIVGLDEVRTVAGDFDRKQLEAKVGSEENLYLVAEALLRGQAPNWIPLADDRPTLIYTRGVANAERLAEIMNGIRPGCARWVCGETPEDERRELWRGFAAGAFQFVVNDSIATEGVDLPFVSCIAMGAPTKSIVVYTQRAGRGFRPADVLASDAAFNSGDAVYRRSAIASSAKPDCLIIDFAGSSKRHKLVTPHDVLGGKYPEEVRARARKLTEKRPEMSVNEALALAEKLITKRDAERMARSKIAAKVQYEVEIVDPFGVSERMAKEAAPHGTESATMAQCGLLAKLGVEVPAGLTKIQANWIISELKLRERQGLCTHAQGEYLKRRGYDTRQMTKVQATAIIVALKRNGGANLPRSESDRILGRTAA